MIQPTLHGREALAARPAGAFPLSLPESAKHGRLQPLRVMLAIANMLDDLLGDEPHKLVRLVMQIEIGEHARHGNAHGFDVFRIKHTFGYEITNTPPTLEHEGRGPRKLQWDGQSDSQ